MEHTYIAIDLKSFYASVECQERDLDPMTTNLLLRIQVVQRKQSVLQSLLL